MNRAEIRFGSGKLDQEIQVGPYQFTSDVSRDEGGESRGPSPHDYLAASLGACTGLTLRMYAQRKAWDLKEVETTVTLEHTPASTQFTRTIRLIGTLDETQRTRLLQIANKCPIHRTLSGKIEIETRLA